MLSPSLMAGQNLLPKLDDMGLSRWYAIDGTSNLWSDTGGATPATVNFLVRRIRDRTPSARIATDTSLSIELKQSGSVYWLAVTGDLVALAESNALSTVLGTTQYEYFWAGRFTAAPSIGNERFALSSVTASHRLMINAPRSLTAFGRFGSTNYVTPGETVALDTDLIVNVRFTGSDLDVYIDDVLVDTVDTSGNSTDLTPALELLMSDTGLRYRFHGFIARQTLLEDDERAAVLKYLAKLQGRTL